MCAYTELFGLAQIYCMQSWSSFHNENAADHNIPVSHTLENYKNMGNTWEFIFCIKCHYTNQMKKIVIEQAFFMQHKYTRRTVLSRHLKSMMGGGAVKWIFEEISYPGVIDWTFIMSFWERPVWLLCITCFSCIAVFTDSRLASQAFIFFLAGFETSSTTLSFCLHELAVNPVIQTKLREEIDATLEKFGGQITYDAVQSMKYLGQVIEGKIIHCTATWVLQNYIT